MTSMLHRERSLPVSHQPAAADTTTTDLRRRLSSMTTSLKIPHPSSISGTTSAATAWAMRRTKSVSSMGETASTSIRSWWDWGLGWILSRKPVFAQDLELNQHETSLGGLTSRDKGSWKHVLFKLRSEIRKLVGSDGHKAGLPQTIRYNSYSSSSSNYSRTFDDTTNKFRG